MPTVSVPFTTPSKSDETVRPEASTTLTEILPLPLMRSDEKSVTGLEPTNVRPIAPVSLTTSVSTPVTELDPRS